MGKGGGMNEEDDYYDDDMGVSGKRPCPVAFQPSRGRSVPGSGPVGQVCLLFQWLLAELVLEKG